MPNGVDNLATSSNATLLPPPRKAPPPKDSGRSFEASLKQARPTKPTKAEESPVEDPTDTESTAPANPCDEAAPADTGSAAVTAKPDSEQADVTQDAPKQDTPDQGDASCEPPPAELLAAAPIPVAGAMAADETSELKPAVAVATDEVPDPAPKPTPIASQLITTARQQPAVTEGSGEPDQAAPLITPNDPSDQPPEGIDAQGADIDNTEVVEAGRPVRETNAKQVVDRQPAAKTALDPGNVDVPPATQDSVTNESTGDPTPATGELRPVAKDAAQPQSPENGDTDALAQTARHLDSAPLTRPDATSVAPPDTESSKPLQATRPAQPQPSAPPMRPEVQFASTNHDRIVTSVRSELMPNGGTMRLRLDPPELGVLQVTVKMMNGTMTAAFETSNEQANRLLSHSLGQLKQALETQGVSVEKLHVAQAPKDQQANADDQRGQQGADSQSSRHEQQRREMIRRMWAKLGVGDPLDLVA